MQEQLQELSLQKNIFYRNSYRKVVSLIIALGILAIFLLTLLVYLTVRKQVLMNYASTTTGEVIELHPLSEPVISNTHLLEWATLVARQAYSFSFLNNLFYLRQASSKNMQIKQNIYSIGPV